MNAVRIEGLGKKYTISHEARGAYNYTALRDVIADGVKSLFSGRKGRAEKKTEEVWALKDINLEISQGEKIGIIGRNGAGKTTLLKILSRITEPTCGVVAINGRVSSLLEVGTGFHPELTGRENIYLNGAVLGMKKKEIDGKFDEIVDFSGVEKFLDTPVKRFSSGMQVRLAFAVAAHLEPEILLVDEVLAVGDAEFQKKCLGKMDDVSRREGRTILFVSHNMAAVRQLCDRGIIITNGSIILDSDTGTVVDKYLQSGHSITNLPEKTFEADDKKKLQLMSVRMLNSDNKVVFNFDCDHSVFIELLIKKNVAESGFYGYMQINKHDGTIVLISDSNDLKMNCLDKLKLGLNKVVLTIPPRSLGVGIYFICFNFTSFIGIDIDSPGNVCSFSIEDVKTIRGNKRKGVFSTLIPWEIRN